jgi:hypothetical protein
VDFVVPWLRDELRVKGRRNPDKVPKRFDSVQARLNMQRKADSAAINQAKLINPNWREVKIWRKPVTGRSSHEDHSHPFYVPDKEVNLPDFRRMRKRDPFHVFSRIY